MNVTNLRVVPETITLYPPTPTSTAKSKRALAPDPAHSIAAVATFPSADGSVCHGLAPRTEAATMRTLCWMTCLAPRKRFALLRGRALVRAVLAVRLMFLFHPGARKALRSSRSLASRVRWRFNRLAEGLSATRFLLILDISCSVPVHPVLLVNPIPFKSFGQG